MQATGKACFIKYYYDRTLKKSKQKKNKINFEVRADVQAPRSPLCGRLRRQSVAKVSLYRTIKGGRVLARAKSLRDGVRNCRYHAI